MTPYPWRHYVNGSEQQAWCSNCGRMVVSWTGTEISGVPPKARRTLNEHIAECDA